MVGIFKQQTKILEMFRSLDKYLFTILMIFASQVALSQTNFFRQYLYNPTLTNPALNASDNNAALYLNYRNQRIGPEMNIRTSAISLKYPLMGMIKKGRWGGVGFSAIDDRSGVNALFKYQAVVPSLAYNLFLSKDQFISFGMNVGYHSQKLDVSSIQTGMQYVRDRGYVGNLPIGENFDQERIDYLGFDVGMLWYQSDHNILNSWLGFSITNINRPEASFYNNIEQTHNSRLNLMAGINRQISGNVWLKPDVLVSHSSEYLELLGGATLRYVLDDQYFPSENIPALEAGIHHAWGKSVLATVRFVQPHFVVGFSYEFDIQSAANINPLNNAQEYAVVLRKTITDSFKSRSRSRTVKGSRPAKAKHKPTSQKQITAKSKVQSAQQPHTGDSIHVLVDPEMTIDVEMPSESTNRVLPNQRLTEVKSLDEVKKELEARITGKVQSLQFDFNSAKLKEESQALLQQIYRQLKNDSAVNIILIGHTDHIGSEQINRVISLQRAQSVKQNLVMMGIEGSRIKTIGKGESEPLNDNSTSEKRSQNRRVEYIIY